MNTTKSDTRRMTSETELTREEAESVCGGVLYEAVSTSLHAAVVLAELIAIPVVPPSPIPCELNPADCIGPGAVVH